VKDIHENSQMAVVSRKLVRAWNEGIEMYGKPHKAVRTGEVVTYMTDVPFFPSVVPDNQLVNGSLYNYLYHMNDQHKNDQTGDYFPNWIFTDLGLMNEFNL